MYFSAKLQETVTSVFGVCPTLLSPSAGVRQLSRCARAHQGICRGSQPQARAGSMGRGSAALIQGVRGGAGGEVWVFSLGVIKAVGAYECPRERRLAGPADTGMDAGAVRSLVVLTPGKTASPGQHHLEEPGLSTLAQSGKRGGLLREQGRQPAGGEV